MSLINYFKLNFALMQYHKYSLTEIENMMPWERDIYVGLLQQHLEEEELKQLKNTKYQTNFLQSENKRLKKILEDITYSSNAVIAKVLIDKQSPFLKSIIINKGSKNDLKKGMAVLSDNYLIGKIVEVNYSTSRVLLLSDLNSRVPVSIEPGNIQSILSGDGQTSGKIQYTKNNSEINSDSIIYTSGTGGLLKPGIPIGKIHIIEKQNTVNFFIDFTQLRYVKVSSYIEEENK